MLKLKLIFSCGAPVATSKERRLNEVRERRGRKTLERPGEDSVGATPHSLWKERYFRVLRGQGGRPNIGWGWNPTSTLDSLDFIGDSREESPFREDSGGID